MPQSESLMSGDLKGIRVNVVRKTGPVVRRIPDENPHEGSHVGVYDRDGASGSPSSRGQWAKQINSTARERVAGLPRDCVSIWTVTFVWTGSREWTCLSQPWWPPQLLRQEIPDDQRLCGPSHELEGRVCPGQCAAGSVRESAILLDMAPGVGWLVYMEPQGTMTGTGASNSFQTAGGLALHEETVP